MGERRWHHLLRRIEQGDAARRELLRQGRVEQQREAVAWRHIAQRALDQREVEADAGDAPQIGHAMRVARIGGRGKSEELRIEVLQIGQSALVEGMIGAGPDLARHERAGRRHDDVVARMAGEQFGLEHLVAVIDVVGNADAGLFLEIGDRVGGDVIRPVVNMQDRLFGGDRGQRQRDHKKRGEA